LADCIKQYHGRQALEIGVGSGFLLPILEENFASVAGSDIDLLLLKHCKDISGAMLACCDLASAFVGGFDLIVSNPPYLPDDKVRDTTVHGGPTGIEFTINIVKSSLRLLARDGKMLLVLSSHADSSALDRLVVEKKIHSKVIKKKRLFYETLSIVELSR
jgi:release factor glutamine methyltransferase